MAERKRKITPISVANKIRQALTAGGSSERSSSVQRFFKEEVQSHGWRTADLRRAALHWRREILQQSDLKFLLQVADHLFAGKINEDKNAAVFLLENITDKFGDEEFRLLESWLPRISNWSDHDALVHYLIAPMIVAKPARASRVFGWAKSRDHWFRRAACVGALVQGARRKMFFAEIIRLSGMLLSDKDDMVQKGLGWLLRETAKVDARRAVPYLIGVRKRARPAWCCERRARPFQERRGKQFSQSPDAVESDAGLAGFQSTGERRACPESSSKERLAVATWLFKTAQFAQIASVV